MLKEFLYYLLLHLVRLYLRIQIQFFEDFYQASNYQWILPPLFAQLLLTHLNLNRLFLVLVAVMRLVLVQRLSMELIPYATVTVSPQMQMKILKTFKFFPFILIYTL